MAEAQDIKLSRLGKRPVPIPKGVTVTLKDGAIEVQGPKGKLSRVLPKGVLVDREGDELKLRADATGVDYARIQGLGRALVASMVKGAAEGYERILELRSEERRVGKEWRSRGAPEQ